MDMEKLFGAYGDVINRYISFIQQVIFHNFLLNHQKVCFQTLYICYPQCISII
jgi:hypothetical protein